MNREEDHRMVVALESIAKSLELMRPPQKVVKSEVRDALITHPKTEEEQIKENLGWNDEEPLDEWTGLREEEFTKRQEQG